MTARPEYPWPQARLYNEACPCNAWKELPRSAVWRPESKSFSIELVHIPVVPADCDFSSVHCYGPGAYFAASLVIPWNTSSTPWERTAPSAGIRLRRRTALSPSITNRISLLRLPSISDFCFPAFLFLRLLFLYPIIPSGPMWQCPPQNISGLQRKAESAESRTPAPWT